MNWTSIVKRNFIASLALLTLMAASSWGQDATGRIVGTVTDPGGAPILDAKVTVTNPATRISQEVTSDDNGYYQVLSLPIGTYIVTIEHAGFRKQVFEAQPLQINQTLKLDAKLSLGQQNEVVEVTEQAANVETWTRPSV